MKFFPVNPLLRTRYPPALLAGLLLAASFPKIGVAGFAWIAPALMLASALGTRGAESFRIGYVAGLAHYLASLYWLLLIPVTGFPILGWVALSAYLALYPAVWVWLALKVPRFGFRVSGSPDSTKSWLGSIEAISSWGWSRRVWWAFSSAAIWVALEMIVSRLLGGFPWNLLGVSQYRILPLIQIASVTGVYGVSFLVVWTSVSLLCAAIAVMRRPHLRFVWMGEILLPLFAMAAAFAFGFGQISHAPAPARELKITLVQPSIPQTLIWNPGKDTERFYDLIRLSEQALANATDILIWPEAAIPKLLRYDEETFRAVTNLAVKHRVWMIVGSDDAEPSRHSSGPQGTEYYNSGFLIGPDGRLQARYCKRNLVVFGEYIPLARWLPFVKWFTPIQGSFTPGDSPVPFALNWWGETPGEPPDVSMDGSRGRSPHARVTTSVLICFEDTFPQLTRESVTGDMDFLVNITNDGWFGESAAQWQHAANATFRAVENRLPLVRCANTGLTCWIDENGRVREIFADTNGSVYGAGFLTTEIPLREPRAPAFYNRHGDWLGWGCAGVAAIALIQGLARKD